MIYKWVYRLPNSKSVFFQSLALCDFSMSSKVVWLISCQIGYCAMEKSLQKYVIDFHSLFFALLFWWLVGSAGLLVGHPFDTLKVRLTLAYLIWVLARIIISDTFKKFMGVLLDPPCKYLSSKYPPKLDVINGRFLKHTA